MYVDATFEMKGGSIVGNHANHDGGGVYLDNEVGGCSFTMSGDAKVQNNTADHDGGSIINNSVANGGGVYVNDGTLQM